MSKTLRVQISAEQVEQIRDGNFVTTAATVVDSDGIEDRQVQVNLYVGAMKVDDQVNHQHGVTCKCGHACGLHHGTETEPNCCYAMDCECEQYIGKVEA